MTDDLELPQSPEDFTVYCLSGDSSIGVYSRIFSYLLEQCKTREDTKHVPHEAIRLFFTWLMFNTWCIETASISEERNEIYLKFKHKEILKMQYEVSQRISDRISFQVSEIMDKLKARDTK